MAKLSDLDQPLVFVLMMTMAVVGMIAVMSWGAARLGWTGLLGLLKGGVAS